MENNDKLVLNTILVCKEPEYRTAECVVEKAIEIPTTLFSQMKQHPLYQYDVIAENADDMYRDSKGRTHCLLVYDGESGDGLLINSEGSSYARYSQYIPCAKMIVDSYLHQQTESIAEFPQTQTHESFDLTFYSPIRVIKFSDEFEHEEKLDDYEKMQCFSEMKSFTERYCNEDSQRGIMIYYDESSILYDKVESAFVSLEIVDGKVMGVLKCKLNDTITPDELEELRNWWSGQASDGIGECLEQHECHTSELGDVYISLYDSSRAWSVLTEEEISGNAPEYLEAPDNSGISM